MVAGKPFFTAVFEELGCTVEWCVDEGAEISAVPFKAAYVRGPCRNILLGERTALNILARASGIATAAREVVSVARATGWHGEVAGTRKVTPGFRLVEKYALLVGGASTHRMDLSSMVMLKGASVHLQLRHSQPHLPCNQTSPCYAPPHHPRIIAFQTTTCGLLGAWPPPSRRLARSAGSASRLRSSAGASTKPSKR